MSKYAVFANGAIFGEYEADSEQGARDACAVDAGYKSEADMVAQLDLSSDLVAQMVEWDLKTPTPEQIRALRKSAGLSQEAAAALVHCKRLAWWNWESGRNPIPAAEWELFTIKVVSLKKESHG